MSGLSCTLTPVFGEIKHVKKHPQLPGNTLSDALLQSCFQADAAKTTRGLWKTTLGVVLAVDGSHELSLELIALKL